MRRNVLIGVLLSTLAGSIGAQGFNLQNFSNATDISTVGSAFITTNNNRLRLTSPMPAFQTGAGWHVDPQGVVAGFDTTFGLRIAEVMLPGPNPAIAEGIAFVIHGTPAGSNEIGGSIWGIGYGAGQNNNPIANSLAIEFDTFQDTFVNDTSNNEVTVHTNGVGNNNENEAFSIGRTTPAINLSDGAIHQIRIRYVPGTLEVFIDNLTTPVLTVAYDFQNGGAFLNGNPVGGLDLPDGTAFVGFTGATGSPMFSETADITSWSFSSTAPNDACFEGTVGDTAGGPFDVLTVNGSIGDFFRRVEVLTFDPFTIELAQPSTNPNPAAHLIFGQFGAADGSAPTLTPFGTICFPVLGGATQPIGTFVLANRFGIGPSPLVGATLTPWTFQSSGIGFPVTATLQGIVVDSAAPIALGVTNAVILDIVTGPAPVIANVTPSSAMPGDPIVISGDAFRPGAVVDIDGQVIMTTSISPTQITFDYPAGLGCDTTLTVTNPDGQTVTAPFNPTPVVTNFPVDSGPVAGGGIRAVVGTGFALGSTVTVDGMFANVINATPSAVVFTLPAAPSGMPGVVDIVITTPGGCSVTMPFTYN